MQSHTFTGTLTWREAWAIDRLFPEASAAWDAHVVKLPHNWDGADVAISVVRPRKWVFDDVDAQFERWKVDDLRLYVHRCDARGLVQWRLWRELVPDVDDDRPGFWSNFARRVAAHYVPGCDAQSPTWVTIR